jgi:Lrp/AsnC family leucine-responsive transcriptional regulator
MDDIDLQIIELLRGNSRISFRKIGQQLGLSTDTAIRRYQRLETEKIVHPVILVDYRKLGYQGLVFYFIRKTGKGNLESIM